jgi:hypothetical protein
VDESDSDRLDAVGEELKNAIATLGPKFGLHASRRFSLSAMFGSTEQSGAAWADDSLDGWPDGDPCLQRAGVVLCPRPSE